MPPKSQRNLKARKLLFVALLLSIALMVIYSVVDQSKPWIVPEEFKQLKNPLQLSESNLIAARRIYRDECLQCHGTRGKGDGPEAHMHRVRPHDLTDSVLMSRATDGEIFYQITEGRRPMPAFKNRLTPDQRWQLVLLVRVFTQTSSAR
jgi:mono/diheme cytochrome c family protein